MKFFATLMLMMAVCLSVAYSQDISDNDSSLDAQQFMDRILKGQVDDEDDEIVDMDDALSKLRMLRKVYRIVADVEAESLLHPNKRFIADTFRKIKDKIVEAAKNVGDNFKNTLNKAKEAFNKATAAVKQHLDFDAIVAKAKGYIHSGMSIPACKNAIFAAATAILGPAASVTGVVAGPICTVVLGGGGGFPSWNPPIASRSVYH